MDVNGSVRLGEGHGRRSRIFHYSGEQLAALRRGDIKAHMLPGSSGGSE